MTICGGKRSSLIREKRTWNHRGIIERVMSGNGYRLGTDFKVLFLKAENNFLLVDVP